MPQYLLCCTDSFFFLLAQVKLLYRRDTESLNQVSLYKVTTPRLIILLSLPSVYLHTVQFDQPIMMWSHTLIINMELLIGVHWHPNKVYKTADENLITDRWGR